MSHPGNLPQHAEQVHSDDETYQPGMPALHTTHHLQTDLNNQTSHLSETLLVPPEAHTHGSAPYRVTTIGPPYGAIRLYAPLPFPHTKMRIYGFSGVVSLQSSLCVPRHPTQEPVLLVKS